jgi:hypothetical protein
MTKPSIGVATNRGNSGLFHSESPENPCHLTDAWRLAGTPALGEDSQHSFIRLTDEIVRSRAVEFGLLAE